MKGNSSVKFRVIVSPVINGNEGPAREIVTTLSKAKHLLPYIVYLAMRDEASNVSDAIQWAADALQCEPRTIWRAKSYYDPTDFKTKPTE